MKSDIFKKRFHPTDYYSLIITIFSKNALLRREVYFCISILRICWGFPFNQILKAFEKSSITSTYAYVHTRHIGSHTWDFAMVMTQKRSTWMKKSSVYFFLVKLFEWKNHLLLCSWPNHRARSSSFSPFPRFSRHSF